MMNNIVPFLRGDFISLTDEELSWFKYVKSLRSRDNAGRATEAEEHYLSIVDRVMFLEQFRVIS